jgi:hypothetical protein
MRAEMGAAINPVTWTPVSTGYGLPTGLRSEQACLRCACLVVDLARLRVRRAGSCVAEVGPGARTSPRSEPLRRNMGRAGIGILDGFPHLRAIIPIIARGATSWAIVPAETGSGRGTGGGPRRLAAAAPETNEAAQGQADATPRSTDPTRRIMHGLAPDRLGGERSHDPTRWTCQLPRLERTDSRAPLAWHRFRRSARSVPLR